MDKIAKILLEIEAIFLRTNNFFTFTSGIKSPIYCDNRLILSYPKARTIIADALTKLVQEKYPDVEMVIGVATGGISHATLIADRLNIPAGYVKPSIKKHGRTNQIEGKLHKSKIVIVEDLISTGKSIFNAQDALKKAGANVLGAVAIFTYQLPSTIKFFANHNLSFYTLTNFSSLIKTAIDEHYISNNDKEILQNWKKEFNKIKTK